MDIEQYLHPLVLDVIKKLYPTEIDEKMIQFQKTRKDFEGDITLVTFPFTKFSKKSPEETGNELGEKLVNEIKIIDSFNVVKGFLNLVISNEYWLEILNTVAQKENFGFSPENGKMMMVEYSSPNTNKPLHLGHLRNNFLGYSVAEILKANGFDVIKTQIINDRGIHICKSMLAWQKFGNQETPVTSGLKGDKLVGKYYVAFDKALKLEVETVLEKWNQKNFENCDTKTKEEVIKLQDLISTKNDEKSIDTIKGKIKELAANTTPIMLEAKEMLKKWEEKDPEVYQLWQTMNNWVYDGFASTYNAMGVNFDRLYYESDTFLTGKDMVLKGLEKGVFYKKDDGSVWIDLTDDGLDEKLVMRADGTTVYMTQDIGTANLRYTDYPNVSGMIYTVGNEQDYHFKVLFLILKKLGFSWAENCYHLSYGMVDLPTGKMKSREGTVVDADDLMYEVVEKAKTSSQERGHLEGMSEEAKEKLYQTIGMGGLKYYLLKVDPKKRMLFNPEESVDLNGNTGPFIQYAYARISSLLKKVDEIKMVQTTLNLEPSEKELIKQLTLYPQIIQDAGKEYSPALIANYTYELVKLFNSFYQSVSILREEDKEKLNLRIQLSKTIGNVIKSSMNLLGIQVPEKM